ncbi:PAS domain S-box protein [bacterium]|nr:PAS domain S-box protein [bacterium]
MNKLLNTDELIYEIEKLNLNLSKTQKILKKTEDKYKNLLERSSDIIFVHQNGKIVLASKGCLKLLGAKNQKELIGKDLLNDIVHPDYRDVVKKRDDNVYKNKKEASFLEEKLIKLNGDILDVDVCPVPYTYKGKPAIKVYARDITKKKKNELENKLNYLKMKNLTDYFQMILEDERSRISQEIHDDLGQTLIMLKLNLQNLQNELNQIDKNNIFNDKISKIIFLSDSINQKLKDISYQLRPPILDHLGLISAIKWQVEEFEKLSGIKCSLKTSSAKLKLKKDVSTTIFRVFQEALNNIYKHSKATKVNIIIKKYENYLLFKIKDNGVGIKIDKINKLTSLGILSMKERIVSINGYFNIINNKNNGTVINIKIPTSEKYNKNIKKKRM